MLSKTGMVEQEFMREIVCRSMEMIDLFIYMLTRKSISERLYLDLHKSLRRTAVTQSAPLIPGPSKLLFKWVPGAISPGEDGQERNFGHFCPCSVRVKNV
jgi:hypothetical protein